MTKSDFTRAFGLKLVGAAILYLALFFAGVDDIFDYEYNTYSVFEGMLALNYFMWMLPLIVSLPFSASFCEDFNGRSAALQILRCGRRRYALSKIIHTWLTGGIVAAVGIVSFFLLLSIHGETQFMASADMPDYEAGLLMRSGNKWWYIAEIGFVHFLSGSFWAMSGLAFSALWPNAALTLCFPVFLYRVCRVLHHEGAPDWLNLPLLGDAAVPFLSPMQMCAAAIGVFGGLSLLFGALFYLGVKRRMENG